MTDNPKHPSRSIPRQRKYYQANKDKIYQNAKKRRQARFKWFQEYKAKQKCKICGEKEPCCLVFHHNDPEKKKGRITQLIARNCSMDKIMKEIHKCTVLCANCHRKLHAQKLRI